METTPKKTPDEDEVIAAHDENGSGTGGSTGGKGQSYDVVAGTGGSSGGKGQSYPVEEGSAWKNAPGSK